MARVDQETDDRGLPQSPARLQAMETFYKHKPLAVLSNQYRGCLPVLQNVLGDLLNRLGIKGLAALHRNIDLIDCECLVLQHHRAIPADRQDVPPHCESHAIRESEAKRPLLAGKGRILTPATLDRC